MIVYIICTSSQANSFTQNQPPQIKRWPGRGTERRGRRAEARLALFCVMLYATSDEFHQLFVASRQARVLDVLIDTSGAALGLLLIWIAGKLRKRT